MPSILTLTARRSAMAASAAQPLPASSIVVPGQLTLRTIHGRNGPFNVGRLVTPIGKFAVKDAELEQYPEGKYDGEFVIRYIDAKAARRSWRIGQKQPLGEGS
tara:strand:+ start:2524 stop:2832 length:309 start_codon:yes stop_codon:yes gene_type:complete